MDVVLESISAWWETNQKRADVRTSQWPLMDNPLPTFFLSVLYLIVIFVGRKVMKDKEPFKLKEIIIVYNVFLVALNAWICFELVDSAIKLGFNFMCNDIDADPNNYNSYRIARACWWYYISKAIEFFDTIFFMLRKKDSQITFLHLFHHSTMFNLWWMGVRWAPGGQSTLSAAVNSFVHIIMYGYYALAAIESLRPYLWWKKYLTMMQLSQFVFIFVTTSTALYETRAGRCNFFEWMGWANLSYMIMMITLFMQFYTKAYTPKDKVKVDKDEAPAPSFVPPQPKASVNKRIKATN